MQAIRRLALFCYFFTLISFFCSVLKMKKLLKRDSTTPLKSSAKKRFVEVNLKNLSVDPRERKQISCYHANDHDNIRRVYLQKRLCQSREHDFPE